MLKLKLFSSCIILLLLGCEKNISPVFEPETVSTITPKKSQNISTAQLLDDTPPPKKQISKQPKLTFMSANWTDLMPKDDLEALLNPPEYLNDIEENSAEDQIASTNSIVNDVADVLANAVAQKNGIQPEQKNSAYQQALTSTRIVDGVDNLAIRLPAFIVPLEFDEDQRVTQFFMVPFFGACIHLPPPPPNQTIFVNYPGGLTLESLYEPYWVSGIINTSLIENDTATAAYTMEVHALEIYSEE